MVKISVIIPSCNSENGIKKCLNSIISQTYENLEIIIVYKPSKDKTLEIIKRFEDKRIKLITQEDNLGPGEARNIGIKNSSGKLIGFVETDDYIAPDFFEILYKKIIKEKADICNGSIMIPTKKKLENLNKRKSLKTVSKFSQKINAISNAASFDKLFKADILKKGVLFPQIIRFEDNPWIVKVLYFSGKMCFAPNAHYYYCPGSRSDEYIAQLKKDAISVAEQIMIFIKEQNISNKDKNSIIKFMTRSFCKFFMEEKEFFINLRSKTGNSIYLQKMYYCFIYKKIKNILKRRKHD